MVAPVRIDAEMVPLDREAHRPHHRDPRHGRRLVPRRLAFGRRTPVRHAVETVKAALPGVRQIVSEPGKAMAQPSMALAMRILEIQEHEDDYVEAVVDASIAELPMYASSRTGSCASAAKRARWSRSGAARPT
jgi:hypothetical protein